MRQPKYHNILYNLMEDSTRLVEEEADHLNEIEFLRKERALISEAFDEMAKLKDDELDEDVLEPITIEFELTKFEAAYIGTRLRLFELLTIEEEVYDDWAAAAFLSNSFFLQFADEFGVEEMEELEVGSDQNPPDIGFQ